MTNLCNTNPQTEQSSQQPFKVPSGKPESNARYLDFDEVIENINQNGSDLFRKRYKVDKKDYNPVYKLVVYHYRDQQHAEELGIDLRKGLLTVGPVGCGKTSLMQILQHMKIIDKPYQIVSVRDVCMKFTEKGFSVIREYGATAQKQAPIFCFDDLGCEPNTRFFGAQTNVMKEILLSRYDLFMQKGVPTHVTTNLSASELESMYGSRVRSRLREMFNQIVFPADSYDKRRL
ncbi:AAA family ATPase [Desertivirga brevis]|uniref:AAA family ATPase n=1 Tax=Desertivirga brevis TaxID=2810310 RepID=UPI001A97989B|nr:AAA family ATPase [Pedobacter sp. SYSU D00873]